MSAEAKKNLQPYIKLDIDKAIKEKKTIYISTALTAMDEHHKAELEKELTDFAYFMDSQELLNERIEPLKIVAEYQKLKQ